MKVIIEYIKNGEAVYDELEAMDEKSAGFRQDVPFYQVTTDDALHLYAVNDIIRIEIEKSRIERL